MVLWYIMLSKFILIYIWCIVLYRYCEADLKLHLATKDLLLNLARKISIQYLVSSALKKVVFEKHKCKRPR